MSGAASPEGTSLGNAILEQASGSIHNRGQLVLSLNRVKTMIKENVEVKSISTEACFAVAKATEQLLETMADKGAQSMFTGGKMDLDYTDIANVVSGWDALDFLDEIVPQKVKVAAAITRMNSPNAELPRSEGAQK